MDDKQAMHAMSIDDAYHVGSFDFNPSAVFSLCSLSV